MEEMRSSCNILIGISYLKDLNVGGREILKVNVKEIGLVCGLGSSGSG
jgi:hypothetical protein